MLSDLRASILSFENRKLAFVSSYGDRLQEAMKKAKADRKALAAELGMSVQAVGQVITGGRSGEQPFNSENSSKAARFLRVDPHWLATGEGKMTSEYVWPFVVLKPDQLMTLDAEDLDTVEEFALGLLRRRQRNTSVQATKNENRPASEFSEKTQINQKARPSSGQRSRVQKAGK